MPHSTGTRRKNTPIFTARAVRERDGKSFYIGFHALGVTSSYDDRFYPDRSVGRFEYGVRAGFFGQVGDKLVFGNGSYMICTSKTEKNPSISADETFTKFEIYTTSGKEFSSRWVYNNEFDDGRNNPKSTYLETTFMCGVTNFNGEFGSYNSFIEYLQKIKNGEIASSVNNVGGNLPYEIYYNPDDFKEMYTWQNYNVLFRTSNYNKITKTVATELLDLWGAGADGNTPEIVFTEFDEDISEPNIPDSDYIDLENFDNTDFEQTDDLISVSDLGAIHLYSPTFGQMYDFHNYLWSTDFLQNWDAQLKKLFGSPEQQIIALLAIYANIPLNSGTASIILGNISSDVQSATIAKQYITIDCGTIAVPRVWGNFLDFEPYTTIAIYLPFISTVDLTANEIVGKTLSLKYNIDVLTGACVAQLKTIDSKGRTNVILNVSGNCGVQIPWNSANYNQLVSNGITAVAGLGATVLSGGLAPVIDSGSIANAVGELAQIGVDTADNVFTGASPRFSRGGSFNTNNGVLCDKIPHLLITRPIQSFAQNYNKYNGYPSNITEKIGNLQGFTKIDKINLSGISATAEEIEQITTLLKSGIIIT